MELGYPDPDEEAGIKPRLPQESFLHIDAYDADAVPEQIRVYEETLAEYYRDYDMDPSWGRRLVSLLGRRRHSPPRGTDLQTFCGVEGSG